MRAGEEQWEEVLGQPTRARLFRLLESSGRPVGTNELAQALGLHPSGIRLHLERLRAAGLVLRESAAQPRGRPRDQWRLSAAALATVERPGAYRQLALWLARTIEPTAERLEEVAGAGRELGREVAADAPSGSLPDVLGPMLGELGFAPDALPAPPGRLSFVLGRCPYADAVRANQAVVCTLHRGLTAGLLDRLDPQARLSSFVPGDPDRAGCLIEVARARGAPAPRT